MLIRKTKAKNYCLAFPIEDVVYHLSTSNDLILGTADIG